MNKHLLATAVLVAIVLMAGFGLLTPLMGHAGHLDCPLPPGLSAPCAVPLTRVAHWQAAFMVVLVEALVLGALAAVFFLRYDLFDPDVGRFKACRTLHRILPRLPLLQELFSAGILNRKEQYYS